MATKGSVFLIGPGFIGLQILRELLAEGYRVTTLVRREEAKASLEKLGSNTILGSLDNSDVIRTAAAAADIVIHTATADHLPSVASVLDGIAERADAGKSTIYIHTSGCSAITDRLNGNHASDTVYQDDKPETIDSIADDAPHRIIDLAILKSRGELGAKAKISIILPPIIYGLGQDSRLSIQIPTMTEFAIKHSYAGYIGGGKAVWGYLAILHYMESTSGDKVLENPYFFIENGEECSWENLAVIGENARNRANRLRALGWKPQEKSAFDSLLTDELPIILAEKSEFRGYSAPVAS
ncbi:hypothetical protein B0J13DRAFT_595171 [Dactylonectria estremocensis]|uniref:NAD(P)-binding domain-containing protein n=1 Tax=Dactylonectria estremocensis TaxID=1079267 RepID=A0A9P9EWV3_9HYPO|nr:hypothetical protein B0J13DRAFT_595171 [Dactylonectria estremocensis]